MSCLLQGPTYISQMDIPHQEGFEDLGCFLGYVYPMYNPLSLLLSTPTHFLALRTPVKTAHFVAQAESMEKADFRRDRTSEPKPPVGCGCGGCAPADIFFPVDVAGLPAEFGGCCQAHHDGDGEAEGGNRAGVGMFGLRKVSAQSGMCQVRRT